MKGTYSLAYVETGRPSGGQIQRAIVWAAWWTGEPTTKPWRSPDAFGLVPRDGTGLFAMSIDYEAAEKAIVAADDAIRAALHGSTLVSTVRVDDSFGAAAYREHLGKPVRYLAPRGNPKFIENIGKERPATGAARAWFPVWHAKNKVETERLWREYQAHGFGGFRGTGVASTSAALAELGLKSPFTEVDVRRAYRKLALVKHPDRGGSDAAFTALTQARDAAMRMVTR